MRGEEMMDFTPKGPPRVSGQVVKPCPYRRDHEWEPESISTPREICRHCYTPRPEPEPLPVPVPLESGDSFDGGSFSIPMTHAFWAPQGVNPPPTMAEIQAALDAMYKKLGKP